MTANLGVWIRHALKLARAQFDFYTTELKAGYCAVPVDAQTVDGARRYLALFGDEQADLSAVPDQRQSRRQVDQFQPGPSPVQPPSSSINNSRSRAPLRNRATPR